MATQALRWARPTYAGYLFTEVWRSDTALANTETATVEAGATLVGEASGNVWFDTGLTRGQTKYYYLRHVNTAGEKTGFVDKAATVENFNAGDFGAQPASDLLTAIAGLTWAAGKGLRMSGDSAVETFDLASAGVDFLAAVDAAAQRAALELGALALLGSINNAHWSGTALAVGNGGTGAATPAGARTALELGTLATQAADAVDIDGGAIDGTPVGASSPAAGAFTSLAAAGLVTLGEGAELEVTSGEITVTHAIHAIDTPGGTVDLETINGGGDILFLRTVHNTRDVVVKHDVGNIRCSTGGDLTMINALKVVVLIRFGSSWHASLLG
ncbi:hypothetical protein [Maricaulis sp.]|uniref:phage tail tip protein J-related protein n=1 Tax=Maricaulis sp. TaxID=1486257 RepID=UPI003A91A813